MLDFPNAPTVGQKYPQPPVGDVPVYTWDGEKWTTLGGAVAGKTAVWTDGSSAMAAQLTLIAPPVNPTDATAKSYVDGAVRWDKAQGLLPGAQLQARSNINATNLGHLFDLTFNSLSGGSFSLNSGEAMDNNRWDLMRLPTGATKTSAAWALGLSGAGALDTGTVALNTWYHVFLIKRSDTGVVDVLISLSPFSPTMPTNYDTKRRIGSLLTNNTTGAWVPFVQLGDEFLWATPVTDINITNLGTTATLFALSVPTGVQVLARIRSAFAGTATSTIFLVNSPDEAVTAAGSPTGNKTAQNPIASNGAGTISTIDVRTNTSAQIRAVASAASSTLTVVTYGWIDRRGKDK